MQAEAIRGMPHSTLRKLYGLERVCVVRSSVPFGMSKICAALPADRMKADALLRGVLENEDEEEDEEKRGEDEDEEADDEGGRLFGVITNLLGLLSNASLLRDPGSRTGRAEVCFAPGSLASGRITESNLRLARRQYWR